MVSDRYKNWWSYWKYEDSYFGISDVKRAKARGAKPHWYFSRMLKKDFTNSIRQVAARCRAMDLLLSLPDIDRSKVGLVAHDYGAMLGQLRLPCVRAYVRVNISCSPPEQMASAARKMNYQPGDLRVFHRDT